MLIALAVIFLPSLFHRDKRVVVDTTSQIPPPLIVEPVIIPKPQAPKNAKVPPVETLFQPDVEASPQPKPLTPDAAVKSTAATKPKVEKPRLNEKGVPVGWVVQVASLKSEKRANVLVDKLLKKNLTAYQQSVNTEKGRFFRVLVGPFIDQATAKAKQKEIDITYKVQSKLLRFNPLSGN